MPASSGDGLLLKISMEGTEYSIDLNKLTIAEEIETEEYFNQPFPGIVAAGWLVSTKALVFFSYLARRRVDPSYTLDQAIVLSQEEFEVKELGAPADEEADKARPTGRRRTSGRRSS